MDGSFPITVFSSQYEHCLCKKTCNSLWSINCVLFASIKYLYGILGSHDASDTKITTYYGCVKSPHNMVCDDSRGNYDSRNPVRIIHVGHKNISCLHGWYFRHLFEDTYSAMWCITTNISTFNSRFSVASDSCLCYSSLHLMRPNCFRPGLHNENLSYEPILIPVNIHRSCVYMMIAVVLFNMDTPLC